MKFLLSLYLDSGSEQKIREVCIYCNRMPQLSTLFRPKPCNSLIINASYTLHPDVDCVIHIEKERVEFSTRSLVLKLRISATITKNYSMPTRSKMKSTFLR